MSSKKYGLILPDKGKPQELKFQASRNVFGDDSDSEGESKKKLVLLRPSDNINRQAKISQEKAVAEDPTVYQYDEIYEEMVGTKEKQKNKSDEEKKPRYIENLIKSANKRKIENERRVERQIQKEREKEGDEFKDKEVFVTSAYKKKLEEMKEEEEREKREEYLESIGDVTKQADLGGFYRHLYEQKLGTDKPSDANQDMESKSPEDSEQKLGTNEPNDGNEDMKSKSPENSLEEKLDNNEPLKSEPLKKRNYRKRKSTETKENLSEGEIEDSDEEINRLNLDNIKLAKKNKTTEENIDADSDFSIDESSDDENGKKDSTAKPEEKESGAPMKINTPERTTNIKEDSKKDSLTATETVADPKPKIDIWKKRTVGKVFEQALKRYYERKAARGS